MVLPLLEVNPDLCRCTRFHFDDVDFVLVKDLGNCRVCGGSDDLANSRRLLHDFGH
jgi:hypothetical protein